ncbi:hypothetical protein B0T21DRAFT_414458 [Apiosordaria backusii]|uniref:Uncharacterized protein n=1 Tax=Apiosordaria backusii TaxID=314023 RepID=A0AA40E3J1_9PEZI|nr:hypothetical protein B0T21DRAFT_414458 [Apiosordaria backusii]
MPHYHDGCGNACDDGDCKEFPAEFMFRLHINDAGDNSPSGPLGIIYLKVSNFYRALERGFILDEHFIGFNGSGIHDLILDDLRPDTLDRMAKSVNESFVCRRTWPLKNRNRKKPFGWSGEIRLYSDEEDGLAKMDVLEVLARASVAQVSGYRSGYDGPPDGGKIYSFFAEGFRSPSAAKGKENWCLVEDLEDPFDPWWGWRIDGKDYSGV